MHLNIDPDPTICICISARRAANALTRLYDEALASLGLKLTQYSLLRTIERHVELTVNELSQKTGLDRTTLTRNLAVLESHGLIKIKKVKEDLRKNKISISAVGVKTLTKAGPLWKLAQEKAKLVLGKDLDCYMKINKNLDRLSISSF